MNVSRTAKDPIKAITPIIKSKEFSTDIILFIKITP